MSPLVERATLAAARFVPGLFFLFGAVGLFRTHFDDFASNDGTKLMTLTVNPLTNLIHLAIGVAGILYARSTERAVRYLLWVGAFLVPFGLLEFVLGDGASDVFGRNTRLGIAHVALGVGCLATWARARADLRRGASSASDSAPTSA